MNDGVSLHLGIGRTDITPDIGGHLYGYDDSTFSKEIHDRLTSTAFVFACGDERAAMISATVCLINTALAAEIRSEISRTTGIPFENIMLCATHTHSGPNTAGEFGWGEIDREYCDTVFVPRILQSVRDAADNMIPVSMGIADSISLAGINRREQRRNGGIGLGQCPWGCFNPKMTVISFRSSENRTVGNIIHYGAHGTAAGKNAEISRDWSGIMTDRVERETGGITAFFNGPEGDVGPRLTNGQTVGDIRYVEELGGVAATDAMRIYRQISDFSPALLSCSSGVLKIPVKPRISLEEAEREHGKYAGKTVNLSGQMRRYYESVIESYRNGYVEKDCREVPQSVIKIGNAVFVSFPYELFSEVGMRIEKYSRHPRVLSLSNTNGSEGYFVTQDQLCRGGYEISMFETQRVQAPVDDADMHLINETLKNTEVL